MLYNACNAWFGNMPIIQTIYYCVGMIVSIFGLIVALVALFPRTKSYASHYIKNKDEGIKLLVCNVGKHITVFDKLIVKFKGENTLYFDIRNDQLERVDLQSEKMETYTLLFKNCTKPGDFSIEHHKYRNIREIKLRSLAKHKFVRCVKVFKRPQH